MKNGQLLNWQAYDDRMSQLPGLGTINVSRPRDEDSGHYQCFAENEYGIATSNSVYLRKDELDKFEDESPKRITAMEGNPFKLECKSFDGWPKPKLFWVIQNTDGGVKNIYNSRMTVDPDGNLYFSNITRADESDDFYFVCAAKSVFRNEYKLGNRVLLEVTKTGISPSQNQHAPILQYVTRENETALRGKQVELYCIYGGTPVPKIAWSKDGKPIQWDDRIIEEHVGKTIIIKNVTFEDAGSYKCEASNGVGDSQTHSINLKVNSEPYFTVEPEIQTKTIDESVEFRCEAFGKPQPEIKWQ